MLINCRMWTTSPKGNSSQGESQLHIFEDNEAVINKIIQGRSPAMRHVSGYHRVTIDWLLFHRQSPLNKMFWPLITVKG